METYRRMPVAFERGDGPWLFDTDGRRYLDALSGIAVCGLGHAHPDVASAIAQQAGTLVHTSNLYRVPLQERLADRLCAAAGMDRAFFGNSGAEANEAAIKLARLHGHRRGIAIPTIVVMEGAFHGRTMATLTATGNRKTQAGFEPLVAGFVRAPYGDMEALAKIAENQPEVVAVLVEPIQGEGGIVVPPEGYLEALRRHCDTHGWLMMLDEVQSGAGRTGRLFAYQHTSILPDVVTLAKGIANGFPIGACLARGEAATVLGPGTHGSTFGGNPLACAAAHATLDVIERDALCARATSLGARMLDGFRQALEGDNRVVDIRGRGLMIGIELADAAPDFVGRALHSGLLLNVTQERVIRLLPPLVLSDEQADEVVARVVDLIRSSA
ncbi:MAG: aspartate aminotransferase family protein [Pseudomonadales bacterium]|jgi:acetylornithine aminotransferase|nr:aspartate aminotransferase family protein [Pseudomonadales bacterium]